MIKKILDGEQIKKILYSVIVDDVGKEKIQTEITLDVGSSQKYIDIIMNKCIAKLCFESNDDSGDDSPDDSMKWEARLRSWRKSRFWLPFWGPKPNEQNCMAPLALLQTVM